MPSWANRITRHFWATRCGVVPERTNDSSCFLAASSTERAVAVGNMTRLNHDQFILSIVMWDGTLGPTAAEELLEIVMRRYGRASTLVTSNRPVEDWGKLLGDSAAVTAMLDRLLHHGHILKCGPRSWRTKLQAEQNGGKATT